MASPLSWLRREFSPATLRRFAWLLLAGLLIVMGAVLLFHPENGALQVLKLQEEKERLEAEVQRLEAERKTLMEQIDRLERGDPFIIEEEARRKGMVRRGEEVYRLRYQEVPDSLAEGDNGRQR